MYTLEQLSDIEEIKRLKHQYCHLGDTKQWKAWAELFTDDYVAEMVGVPRFSKTDPVDLTQTGLKDVVGLWSEALKNVKTIHSATMPEITLTSATTATGVWALHDTLFLPTNRFEGWGHYHEDYVKLRGAWKFKKVRTTRIRVEELWYDGR